jgi:anti-sigma factor RsiW
MHSESDILLLEAYLDDELTTSEVQRLDSRLNAEPELLAVLDSLRAQRMSRIGAFVSLSPTETQAQDFAERVLAGVGRRERQLKMRRGMRICGGVAACLLVGFAVGWAGRGTGGGTMPQTSQLSRAVPASPAKAQAHCETQLVIHAPQPEPGQFQVAILDDKGNVIAIQRFSKLDDARQFADDLGQYELRRNQLQDSQAMLVSDRF